MTKRNYRVLHGFLSSAGQPGLLASGLTHLGVDARNIIMGPNKYGYRADYQFGDNNSAAFRNILESLVPSFDILHIHATAPFYNVSAVTFPMGTDLLALKALGIKIIIHFRGSEVRQAPLFSELSPHHYVSDGPEGLFKRFSAEQQRDYVSLCRALADKILVTDAELLSYVPDATILPRAMDMDGWHNIGVSDSDRPLIVHAPSRPGVKGTQHVLAAVERLRDQGLSFEFALIQGLPQHEARILYEKADIIVDQLRIGWYGVLATEGMALGKAVVAYIREDLHPHFPDGLPLAMATPETVEKVLKDLILNREYRSSVAEKGHQYCSEIHDHKKVAQQAIAIYDEVIRANKKIDISTYMRINEAQEIAIGSQILAAKHKAAAQVKAKYESRLAEARRLILEKKATYKLQAEEQKVKYNRGIADAVLRAEERANAKYENDIKKLQSELSAAKRGQTLGPTLDTKVTENRKSPQGNTSLTLDQEIRTKQAIALDDSVARDTRMKALDWLINSRVNLSPELKFLVRDFASEKRDFWKGWRSQLILSGDPITAALISIDSARAAMANELVLVGELIARRNIAEPALIAFSLADYIAGPAKNSSDSPHNNRTCALLLRRGHSLPEIRPDLFLEYMRLLQDELIQLSGANSIQANRDCIVADEQWYDDVYEASAAYKIEAEHSVYIKVWERAAQVFSNLGVESIVDFGCGPGQFGSFLISKIPNLKYTGLDLSGVAIRLARERCPQGTFVHGDAMECASALSDAHGMVCCFEFLEHVTDDIGFLSLLPSEKNLLASVPNFDSQSHVRFFRDIQDVRGRYEGVLDFKNIEEVPLRLGSSLFLFHAQRR